MSGNDGNVGGVYESISYTLRISRVFSVLLCIDLVFETSQTGPKWLISKV